MLANTNLLSNRRSAVAGQFSARQEAGLRIARSSPNSRGGEPRMRAATAGMEAAAVQTFTADAEFCANAHISSREQYDEMYKRSIEDPAGFWADMAQAYTWQQPWQADHMSYNFDVRAGPISSVWFQGATTNLCYNCLDRHVQAGAGDAPCFLWEGNNPGRSNGMTYSQVLEEVCRTANWLKSVGVKKGDSVAIYLPMETQLPIAMLACARIGAVHSVVFGGFSAESLASRVQDCKAKILITASGVTRGAKSIPLKRIADDALAITAAAGHEVPTVLVVEVDDAVPAADCSMEAGRDTWWHEEVAKQSAECEPEWVDAEHPLFLLYTSGSTGQPKGVLHTTGGYMVMAGITTKYVFDMRPGDVYWCTADCGWITGHTYLAYGPLLNGATSLVFEGVPSYPDAGRLWEIVAKHRVSLFYTAPTAIRALMAAGEQWVTKHDRSSLRVLGTVGEPINPEAWRWYHEVVGEGRCPIVDTWWQTETGGHLLTPLPGAWPQKPGSATLPFFGAVPVLVDEKGNELQGACEGYLCIKQSWPSTIRTVFGDQERFETTYFKPFPGYYFTGDGARRDEDGYYWITGRVDDVMNVSGHRIGTAEVESALVLHAQCAEAAVVGVEHAVKGQSIYAYITLNQGVDPSDELRKELVMKVREQIGPFAAPDVIHWADGLPKTRSGKIMRRVLRKIASHQESELGDTSTLADPSVVETLISTRGQ